MPAPLNFDEHVAREICDRMAEGEALTAICKTRLQASVVTPI
jgi:hypothetical protein